MYITAESAIAWLESLAPYSTVERDQMHADIAALVRALAAVREKAIRHSCSMWLSQSGTTRWCSMCEALAAVDAIEQGREP